jgi:NAD(P)-dependent dehydrogenase (short-subunit alcohol dehydrogenase family)
MDLAGQAVIVTGASSGIGAGSGGALFTEHDLALDLLAVR